MVRTKLDLAQMLRMRHRGAFLGEIAKAAGCNESTAWHWLKKAETMDAIPLKTRAQRNQEFLDSYRGGTSADRIAEVHGVTRKCVTGALLKMGEKLKPRGDYRSYELNESAFSVVTEESAYWAGFIFADGCVYHPKNKSWNISIQLKGSDAEHLEKFKRFMRAGHPVRILKTKQSHITVAGTPRLLRAGIAAKFGFSSRQVASDLARFGITQRKSATARALKLDRNRHFWRGVIDGDGCISLTKGQPTLILYGSYVAVRQFRLFMKSHFSGLTIRVAEQPGCWRACFSGIRAAKAIELLYHDSSVSLDRKMAKADIAISRWAHKSPQVRPSRDGRLREKLLAMLRDGRRTIDIMAETGLSENSIIRWRKKVSI